MAIPLFANSLERYLPEITRRLDEVVRSGRYILGPEVEAFEAEFAGYLGVSHCIGVGNGTDALTIALRALGVGPGDEVVLPSFTFYATAEAAANVGAKPVFCDVDPETYCVTAATVEPCLGERTKAIIPVHLFGRIAPVEELRGFGLPLLEDAAQAAGAELDGQNAGSLGDAATFSFFPSKNLPCLGDGGAVVTNDDALAGRIRELRFHGSRDKETFVRVGYNSRLDALQAAALRVLLPELDGWNAARRRVARRYREAGLGEVLSLPSAEAEGSHVYHLYVARHPAADALIEALARRGIGARSYYRRPVHAQPGMDRFVGGALRMPATDEVARTNIALPMGPELADEDIAQVVQACSEELERLGVRT